MSAISVSKPNQRIGFLILTFAGIMLAAMNLRPTLTSVSPLLNLLGTQLGLSSIGLGALTTLPVLCLGLTAPLTPVLVRRIGQERSVILVLIILITALILRPYIGSAGFFVGTAVAGGALGILGVLLPALVKRDFPHQASLITGLYTMALSLGAAVAAGATEPLRQWLGGSWQLALAVWMVPAVLALLIWLPRLRSTQSVAMKRRHAGSLLRNPLAWQVTLFMGLQSSLAYIVFGWLPAILSDRGLSVVAAGMTLSSVILISMVSAVAAPWISTHMRDQRAMNATVMLLFLIGLAGCLYASLSVLWIAAIALGLGLGGAFAMALTLLALRAPDVESAGQLSAMAQGFGYVLAAFGPLAVGLIHDVFSWSATGVLIGAIGILALIFGLYAGRNRTVGE